MKLYIVKPTPTSLDIDAYAAEDIQAAFRAGRYVTECKEVKDAKGNVYVVTLTPKGKATKQQQLFEEVET